MMKKISILAIAAIAMVSCGKTYTAQTDVALTNQNDSMNYALGMVNGAQLKMYQLRNDSSSETITEFIDALQRGYDGTVEELSETASIGKNIGQALKKAEETGLADNPAWALNQKLFFQGMVNGLYNDTAVMNIEVARNYFQEQYQASAMSNDSIEVGKAVKGKCPSKVKTVSLKTQNDSVNYAFGYLNGNEVAQYVLATDSTGEMRKEFIEYVNKGLKSNVKNPQLVNMGEQIGKSIKEQEPQGLLGEQSLSTNFELIKKGFINGLLNYNDIMSGEAAGEYVQNTLNYIKYGNVKEEGEKFLEENKLRAEVITTESGLQYEVLKKGKGKTPTANDKVKVHYHGTLINGTIFDSSVDRKEPVTFGVTQVIPGWTEALQLMSVGSKFKLYIPQELAYGAQQAGQIPPFSTLIFEVELLSIEK
jgi:FKBP-type peptidyl-prolyl cis-trans isomerase FklB